MRCKKIILLRNCKQKLTPNIIFSVLVHSCEDASYSKFFQSRSSLAPFNYALQFVLLPWLAYYAHVFV